MRVGRVHIREDVPGCRRLTALPIAHYRAMGGPLKRGVFHLEDDAARAGLPACLLLAPRLRSSTASPTQRAWPCRRASSCRAC
eukprot:5455596-Alexandrium_andersonii.AAC.1